MLNFLKNVKNLAIVSASSNFNWLVDNRNLISNVAKIIILTAPALQKELKKQYRGSDVYFKYIDEMAEAAQICDCVMFVNVTKNVEKEYLRLAKKHGMLKYVVAPKGADYNSLIINRPIVNGCEYEMFDVNLPPATREEPIEYRVKATPLTNEVIAPIAEVAIVPPIIEEPKKEEPKKEIKSKKPFGRGRK